MLESFFHHLNGTDIKLIIHAFSHSNIKNAPLKIKVPIFTPWWPKPGTQSHRPMFHQLPTERKRGRGAFNKSSGVNTTYITHSA